MKPLIIKSLILCVLCLVFIQSNEAQKSTSAYKVIYEADSEGKPLNGSLDELLKYVQNGSPIRVGWVLNLEHQASSEKIEMQHWTDAGFITTLRGHVFAQVRPIFQQGPGIDEPPSVHIVSGKPNGWVAIVGTTGLMRQHFEMDETMLSMLRSDGMSDEEIAQWQNDRKSQKIHTKWAVMIE